jgi:hypothetical protein
MHRIRFSDFKKKEKKSRNRISLFSVLSRLPRCSVQRSDRWHRYTYATGKRVINTHAEKPLIYATLRAIDKREKGNDYSLNRKAFKCA